MSFKVHSTWKPHISLDNEDNDNNDTIKIWDKDAINKAVEKAKERRREPTNTIDFRSLLKNSSLNPDINPDIKKQFDKVLEEREKENERIRKAAFDAKIAEESKNKKVSSVKSLGIVNYGANFPEIQDDNLDEKKEYNDNDNNNNNNNNYDQNEDEETKKQKDIERSHKKMIEVGYPATASMLRGFVHRVGPTSGGIRKTAMGMVDGY